MSRARKIAKAIGWRLGLVLGSITVTLLILEVVAWALLPKEVNDFFTPFEHDDSGYKVDVKDPDLLYTLAWYVPGATGTTGVAPVTINNLGLRDEYDYPFEKQPGCFRVLGLGDSMTFGKGVAEPETYLGRLEDRLKQRYPGRCIEVLNAGQPNTNFFMQWIHYKLKWWQFNPDLVLVGFFVYNDTQLEEEEEPYSLDWMEFIDRNDWLKSSHLVRWAYYRAFFDMGHKALENGLPRFFADDYKGWEQFRDAVLDFDAFAKTKKQKTAFLLIPVPVGYDEYPYREYHDKATQFLTQGADQPVFDLLEGLRSIKARKHWVHPSDGHPDAFVHDQMSLYMSEVMPWDAWLSEVPAAP